MHDMPPSADQSDYTAYADDITPADPSDYIAYADITQVISGPGKASTYASKVKRAITQINNSEGK